MEHTSWYSKYTIILAGIILTVYAMIQAATLLKLILFSLFLSLLVIPFCNWLEKVKINRILAAIISILVVVMVIGGIGAFFYLQLSSLTGNVESLEKPIDELISGVQAFLSENLGFDGYINFEVVKETVYDYLGNNTEALSKWLAGAVSIFTSLFLIPVLMFLILIFRDFIKKGILKIYETKSEKHRATAETIMNSIKIVIQDYVYGLFILMIVLGFIYSMMLYIIGVDYACFFGSFAGFLSLIPILGPIIGSLFPAFYALLTMDSIW